MKVPSVLTINAGSSSLRMASYRLEQQPRCAAEIQLSPAPAADGSVLEEFLARHALPVPDMVMHRVVHGGARYTDPCLIDEAVETEIGRLEHLAPLHNAVALNWVQAARSAFGPVCLQAACFDTGFYAELPPQAAEYALPRELTERYQIRRYGFHGLAHQSMLERWRQSTQCEGQRVISMQLGSGCSITATDHGWPIETSMGFSPLEGLMMATRAGDVDPSVLLHLMEEGGFSSSELGWILNESSGLRAISGQSADMEDLLAADTEGAALAIAMFCHRLCKYLGAYLALLGGVDAILFGGGIGENAPAIRARVLDHFGWAGIHVSASCNARIQQGVAVPIHSEDSRAEIWVVPPEEARLMAESAHRLLIDSYGGQVAERG